MNATDQARLVSLKRLYGLLDDLATRTGGPRRLVDCTGRHGWPRRGVYFFFEEGEYLGESGDGPRVVRVGTHALTARSRTTLWNRLSQHRGQARSGGGNHRGSIFRLLVGGALVERERLIFPTWGQGSTASSAIRAGERELECRVSQIVGRMPFLWLAVDDEAGAGSLRGVVERNAIALLSNAGKRPLDAPSPDWLGQHCPRDRVRRSGLWNQNHVGERHDPDFLGTFERLVAHMERPR